MMYDDDGIYHALLMTSIVRRDSCDMLFLYIARWGYGDYWMPL